MSYKFTAYLEGREQLARLSALAMRLGYTREVGGTTVANLSAFLRGLATGEVRCSIMPRLDAETPQ